MQLFLRQGVLMSVGFDPRTLEVAGEPVTVLEDVQQAFFMPNSFYDTGAGQMSISRAGHIAYASGGVYPEDRYEVASVRLDGVARTLDLEPRRFVHLRVSPTGDRLLFSAGGAQAVGLYLHDFARGVTQRLSTGGYSSAQPEWSPDGLSVAFTSTREDGVRNIYRMPVDGGEPPRPLAPAGFAQTMASWSANDVIAYLQQGDIWILPPTGAPAPFFESPDAETHPTFSPDGRWLAYVSNQGGRQEVYVRPYPGPGSATLVSGAGGTSPIWERDGRRILYLEPGAAGTGVFTLMAVDVSLGDELRVGRATPLFGPWTYLSTTPTRSHDFLADGSLIAAAGLAVELRGQNRVREVHVVLNFTQELRDRVGR